MEQLLKVPELVSHFAEHKAGNRSMSLVDFIAMHYAASSDHDARDKELPFKSDCNAACATAVHLPQLHATFLRQPLVTLPIPYAEFKPAFYHHLVNASIWQPPRC